MNTPKTLQHSLKPDDFATPEQCEDFRRALTDLEISGDPMPLANSLKRGEQLPGDVSKILGDILSGAIIGADILSRVILGDEDLKPRELPIKQLAGPFRVRVEKTGRRNTIFKDVDALLAALETCTEINKNEGKITYSAVLGEKMEAYEVGKSRLQAKLEHLDKLYEPVKRDPRGRKKHLK